MKRLVFIGVILTGLATTVFAYGDWILLNKFKSEAIDYNYTKCYYKDLYENHKISITIKGGQFSCPYSIQYNPVSGKWKQQ